MGIKNTLILELMNEPVQNGLDGFMQNVRTCQNSVTIRMNTIVRLSDLNGM